jgi:xylan 1,4-beta-xylosidase
MYSSYTAASYARIYDYAANAGINLEGAVTWAFEFEDQPWFAGFRDLATNGVDKAVVNVIRMFGQMKGDRLEVDNKNAFALEALRTTGVHNNKADIDALATATKKEAYIMLWNYYDDDLPAPPAEVHLELSSIPAGKISVTQYRIDDEHSNAYTLWKKMGSPQAPDKKQYEALEKKGKLEIIQKPFSVNIKNKRYQTTITLPRQAVSLVKISW